MPKSNAEINKTVEDEKLSGKNTLAMLLQAGKPDNFDHSAPVAQKKRIIRIALIVTNELNLIKQQQELMRLYLLECEQRLADLKAYREGLLKSSTPVNPKDIEKLDASIKQIKQDIKGLGQLLEHGFITLAGLELYASASTEHERTLAVVAINVDRVQATANTKFIDAVKDIKGIEPKKLAKVVDVVKRKLKKQPRMVQVVDVVQRSQQQHAAENTTQEGPSAIPTAPKPQPGKLKKKDPKVQKVYTNKRAVNMELYLTSTLLDMNYKLAQVRAFIRSNPALMNIIQSFQSEMNGFVDSSDALEKQLLQLIEECPASNEIVTQFQGLQQNTQSHFATARKATQSIDMQQSISHYDNALAHQEITPGVASPEGSRVL